MKRRGSKLEQLKSKLTEESNQPEKYKSESDWENQVEVVRAYMLYADSSPLLLSSSSLSSSSLPLFSSSSSSPSSFSLLSLSPSPSSLSLEETDLPNVSNSNLQKNSFSSSLLSLLKFKTSRTEAVDKEKKDSELSIPNQISSQKLTLRRRKRLTIGTDEICRENKYSSQEILVMIDEILEHIVKQEINASDCIIIDIVLEKNFKEVELLIAKMLFELCADMKVWNANPTSIATKLRYTIIGLLARFETITIIKIIFHLYCHQISISQKSILLLMSKEIIMWDDFSHGYNEILDEAIFKEFLKIIENPTFKEFIVYLVQMRKNIHNYDSAREFNVIERESNLSCQVDFSTELNEVLKHKSSKNIKPFALEFAKCLRDISAGFYDNVEMKEFMYKEDNKPHIYSHLIYINKLTNFIAYQILSQNDSRKSTSFYKICIYAIEYLLAGETPDFNSAIAILSAFDSYAISRLGNFFLNDRVLIRIHKIEEILSPLNDWQNQRKILSENINALPFFGIIKIDLERAKENFDDEIKTIKTGKVLSDILERKRILKKGTIKNNKFWLLDFLQNFTVIPENELEKLSLKIKPKSTDMMHKTQARQLSEITIELSTSPIPLNKGIKQVEKAVKKTSNDSDVTHNPLIYCKKYKESKMKSEEKSKDSKSTTIPQSYSAPLIVFLRNSLGKKDLIDATMHINNEFKGDSPKKSGNSP